MLPQMSVSQKVRHKEKAQEKKNPKSHKFMKLIENQIWWMISGKFVIFPRRSETKMWKGEMLLKPS